MLGAENSFETIITVFNQLEERNPIKIRGTVKPKKIVGFDTETVNGKAVLICSSDRRVLFPNSFEEIAQFLTQRKYNSTLNFFWNIDFDFFAVVKWLPHELLELLYENKGLLYENYFIKWIPRKFFSITRVDKKRTSRFYDLWQFYRMSLNEAARRYLNDQKISIDIKNIEQYINNPSMKSRLINYCIKDSELTAQLGELLQSKLNSLGIDFSKPFSCGYISTKFFFKNKLSFPFKKTEWNLYALLSYYGGRFEVLHRGYFRKVYQFDINSAYPFYISQLTNPFIGTWIKSKDLDYDAEYGFAKITITDYEHEILSPIPWRLKNGTVIYPNFERPVEYYITLPELRTAEKLGLQFDVIDSWLYYGEEQPMFPEIVELYERRKEAKQQKDKVLELVLKIIMNSLYGKFAEKQFTVRASLKPTANAKEIEINGKSFYVRELCRPGLLFCPVLAAYITAQTRVQLLETCRDNLQHVIAFATDSIITSKPFIEESDKLGAWKLECEGEALVLMSGVYTIRNEEQTKTRFRGFPLECDFFKLLEQHRTSDKIAFEFEKSVKLGEIIAFHNQYSVDDLNMFRVIEKELSCFGDEKRDWLNQPCSFGELLENEYDSVPKTIGSECGLRKKAQLSSFEKRMHDRLRMEIEEIAWAIEKMQFL